MMTESADKKRSDAHALCASERSSKTDKKPCVFCRERQRSRIFWGSIRAPKPAVPFGNTFVILGYAIWQEYSLC